MARKPTNGSMPIETVKHKDKRVNIPTEELRDFVADDEKSPRTMLYPRDPSLDPQLVWKGKDEQDMEDLAVPAVPVYIQEKIHPQAIIEDLRAQARKDAPQEQMGLFGDFNGIAFEELIDFYHHEKQKWSNRMILGDSLLVMTSLAEKEGLKGKVQTIYLDPPYGIKFGSNWQVSTRKRDVKDGRHEDVTHQPEQIRAFRDTWKLGIHSYLAYLRDRLALARELLTETGSVFVQIGDENVHLVRCLMDEVFGADNFCSHIIYVTTSTQGSELLPTVNDNLLWYSKNREQVKYRDVYEVKSIGGAGSSGYNLLENESGDLRRGSKDELLNGIILNSNERLVAASDLTSSHYSLSEPIDFEGKKYSPGNRYWSTSTQGMYRLGKAQRLLLVGNNLRFKRYFDDFTVFPRSNVWTDTGVAGFTSDRKVYVVQTNEKVIERCLLMTTDPGDLVLDPTCGSGTTAYVAEQWGRRWITCDTSRVALALARTRLMSAKFPYYYLSDSPDGVKKEAEVTGKLPPDSRTEGDIRKGFVYKRVPHITLKAIANNTEIDAIHARWQEKIGPVLKKLGALLNGGKPEVSVLPEWQVSRDADSKWPAEVKELHEGFWKLRRDRQKEIDASIARNADTEVLYDQPYEDSKRIRVTGPFTVESLSPHRVLSTDEERPVAEREAQREAAAGQFETMILDNLKKAGVQNTRRNERLKFDRLETYAGEWLHAAGEYTDNDGIPRKVAVCLGPEHGTVGPELIKEAAKEALKGVGFDLLIVCGFAFDAHAGETVREFTPQDEKPCDAPVVAENLKQYGKLPVLLARMNPDLSMGEELLKNTGTGNLFMVFGEPDVTITKKDGKVQVDIKGVDVYDPTTGVIRSSSTDEIACWFIDTDYNGESFFVRHAYFTGANEPYDKLKRALRAEIDEAAWSALYSTTSRPFDVPAKGRIAVKVINHYGDEVLKIFEVR